MFSDPKFLTIIAVPIPTGILSFCASFGLIINILFYSKLKLTRVVRRILFGFCIYDCIYSVCAALSVAMLPSGTSYYAIGNLTTCDIQGFLQQLGGLGCIFYNLSLSVYYVAIMKFDMKEREIAKKLELWMHLVPNGFAIATSIFLYIDQQYAPLTNQHLCWVGTYPQGCLDDPDTECIRGGKMTAYYAEFLLVIPFFIVYFFLCILMMTILHSIYTTKKKSDKWKLLPKNENSRPFFRQMMLERKKKTDSNDSKDKSDTLVAEMSTSTGKKTMPTYTSSRSGTKQDPLAFDVSKVKKQIRRESKLDHNAPIVLSSINKSSNPQDDRDKFSLRKKKASIISRQEARAKIASQQCLLYLSSFLLCFIFTAVARIYGIVDREAPFPLLLLARFFHPSQGVFFILVYCRPYVKSIRAQNAELTWMQAFWIAFKGGGDNDECTRPSYYDMVMDKDGIDVPRLPEAERQRRQEIVRQQFKRKSVTYKPISLKNAEDKKGLDLMLALGCEPSDEQVTEIEEGFGRIQAIDFREKGLGPCDETLEKKKRKLEP